MRSVGILQGKPQGDGDTQVEEGDAWRRSRAASMGGTLVYCQSGNIEEDFLILCKNSFEFQPATTFVILSTSVAGVNSFYRHPIT